MRQKKAKCSKWTGLSGAGFAIAMLAPAVPVWSQQTQVRSVQMEPPEAIVSHTMTAAAPMRIGGPQHRPDVSEAEFARMADALALEGDQHELVMSLYAGYIAAFEEASKAARPEGGPMVMNHGSGLVTFDAPVADETTETDFDTMVSNMLKRQQVFQSTRRDLLKSFHHDVRATLHDGQAARWDPYHRAWTRRSTLTSLASLPREGVDLIELIETSESVTDAHRAALQDTMTQYDRELFGALSKRNELVRNLEAAHDFEMQELREPESFMDDMDRLMQSRYAVMDVNLKYLDVMANQLPTAVASDLRHAFETEAYPRAFRKTRADRYLQTIKDLETLSDEQREQVAHIDRGYGEQMTRLQRQFLDIESRHEAESRDRIATRKSTDTNDDSDQGMVQIMAGMGTELIADAHIVSEETRDARRGWRTERDGLVNKTVDDLHALLNPEQQEIAQKPKDRAQILFGQNGEIDTAALNELINEALDGITLDLDGVDGAVEIIALDGGDGEVGIAVTVSPPGDATGADDDDQLDDN